MSRSTSAEATMRSRVIRAALEVAVRQSGLGQIRDALGEVVPLPGRDAEETWLAAELAYLDGDFATAAERYSRFDDLGAGSPAQMRYLSCHRQSFSALQLGDVAGCERHITAAEKVIDGAPSLEWLRADVLAMRAHVAEVFLDHQTAWALFTRAFTHASEHGYVRRMRTVSSDLARVALLVGRVPEEGLAWVERARELATPEAEGPLLALDIREGMLREVLREWDAAEALYQSVWRRASNGTSAAVDVAHRLAELRRARGHAADALPWYDLAIEEARRSGLARHEAYAWLGKAGCLAELLRSRAARHAFAESIARGLASANKPTALVVDQLDVAATWPSVFGVATSDVAELHALIERLQASGTAALIQRGTRQVKLVRTMRRAVAVLRALVNTSSDTLQLDGCEVDLVRSLVLTAEGESPLPEAQRSLVEVLARADEPLSVADLAEELDATPSSVEKRVSRLRKCLPASALRTDGGGRVVRRYGLVHAKPSNR